MNDNYEFVHDSVTLYNTKVLAITCLKHTVARSISLVEPHQKAFIEYVSHIIRSYFDLFKTDDNDDNYPSNEWWHGMLHCSHYTADFEPFAYDIRVLAESAIEDVQAFNDNTKGGENWTADTLIDMVIYQIDRKFQAWKKSRAHVTKQTAPMLHVMPYCALIRIHDFLTPLPSVVG